MALTSMSVVGQPSVLYLRRSHPPSRYQPSRPRSWILASTSSSVYGLGFASVSMRSPPSRALHHNAAIDVDGLTGDEPGLGGYEPERGRGDVFGPAPACERRGFRDRAVEVAVCFPREPGLDPSRAEDVDADLGRQPARQALAEGEHAALDGAEQLGVLARHSSGHVIPAHVDNGPTAGLLAHERTGGIRARDGSPEIDRQQEVEL